MKNSFSLITLMLLVSGLHSQKVSAADNFYAYYTKVQHSATDYMGKYADIIVVLDDDKRLEFTRQTGYQPLWRTAAGSYLIDDLFPDRDRDYQFYYNYVRLIDQNPDSILVHWRYIPDIKTLDEANRNLDPLVMHGFLGVVHELYTIFPDGRVEREVKAAEGTNSRQWKSTSLPTKQTIKLLDNGIEHGRVNWGGPRYQEPPSAAAAKLVSARGLPEPLVWLKFDEALDEPEGFVLDEIQEMEAPIEGLQQVYKKGVSGTCLALDGYYSGAAFKENTPSFNDALSLEGWIALDVYPYNEAPLIHRSKGFGREGYYLGIDAYGKPFFRINGTTLKAKEPLPLLEWHHLAATIGNDKLNLFVDGKETAGGVYRGKAAAPPDAVLKIGVNTEPERCTDYVRTTEQNLLFIFGLQGVIDELKMYDKRLSAGEITDIYSAFKPADIKSPLAIGVLPGEMGTAEQFGAFYKTLPFQELWDNMWRLSNYADVVIKFDNFPTSVIFWHGSNYAANWITDNNHWMSDQSSEIFTKHGCSEHMADKQLRHCHVRIIENSPARVVVHWRYPCVDVSYYCASRLNWTDEYHTIYPDGTGIRKVEWNKRYDTPGFEDIQFFTNPGETPLDVVDLQAMTVANLTGEVEDLIWEKPNKIPKIHIKDATIELLNSKSDYKIFVIFQGGKITPWGQHEQSKYTDDPFAGPWNHWPVHFVPSDGRFAVAADRITHFALGANDHAPEFGSMVHYGFTNKSIEAAIPFAKYWQHPPEIRNISGGKGYGFDKDEKAYPFRMEDDKLVFTIAASEESPLVNPAFVLRHWEKSSPAKLFIDGRELEPSNQFRQGSSRCPEGHLLKVIWLEMTSRKPVKIEITR